MLVGLVKKNAIMDDRLSHSRRERREGKSARERDPRGLQRPVPADLI